MLPGDCSDKCDSFTPFIPPFLKPPRPFFPPFIPHPNPAVPGGPLPPSPGHDIFTPAALGNDIYDNYADTDDHFFDNLDEKWDGKEKPWEIQQEYSVVWERYSTDTYTNIILNKNLFDFNEEKILVVHVENAA